MFGRVFRALFGFLAACLAAGATMVLFVYTPVELATTPAGQIGTRLSEAALLALAAATHSAVFSAPFALAAVVIAEWRGISAWIYYVAAGMAIAALGVIVQHWSEATGELSIVNKYALSAFALTGFVAGLIYWLCAGRRVTPTAPPPDSRPEAPAEPVAAAPDPAASST